MVPPLVRRGEANLKQAASGLEACDLGALAAKAKAAPGAPAAVALAQCLTARACWAGGRGRRRIHSNQYNYYFYSNK